MLRLAIIGAGVMGANHARVARQIRDATVTHVVDADLVKARAVAAAHDAEVTTDVDDLTGRIDAAVVAAPSELHAELGVPLLKAGVAVLVEKPIAPSVAEAEQLVEAAAVGEAVLQVGHVERFNPAVLELDALVRDVVHVAAARISPYSPRIAEGVIFDLMIHDLDLVRSLVGSEVAEVSATARAVRSETEDLATALLTFTGGVTATLTASRIGQNKIRSLEITQRADFVAVDLLRQDVTVNRVDHVEYLSDEGARYRQTGVVELPFLEHRGEPLLLELSHFVECASTGATPRVSGLDGLRAVELARRIADVAVRS